MGNLSDEQKAVLARLNGEPVRWCLFEKGIFCEIGNCIYCPIGQDHLNKLRKKEPPYTRPQNNSEDHRSPNRRE